MLKGLRGILEKGLQIAAPIIGGSMFGAPGAAFGSEKDRDWETI